MGITYLGMYFASKVLMFADPQRAVVYDSIIAERLKQLGGRDVSWQPMVVSTVLGSFTAAKGKAYKAWCSYCVGEADRLNAQGSHWSDQQGHGWRAVDVERTFFDLTGKEIGAQRPS